MEVFDLHELARHEERRLANGVREVADEWQPFAGGIMARGAPGGWFNAAFGAGFAGKVEPAEVRAMIEFFHERSIEPRVELCPLADGSLVKLLAEEGFVCRLFETVFFLPLNERSLEASGPAAEVPDLEIQRIDPTDRDEVEEYVRVATSGFLPPGITEWPDDVLETARRVARHPRTIAIKAMLNGKCIGAAAAEIDAPVAALFGVTVLPEYRRRGIQMAMIDWRLREVHRRGARWATIGSRPGVATERNAMRAGFRVAYTRVVLVRPGPGLVPVME